MLYHGREQSPRPHHLFIPSQSVILLNLEARVLLLFFAAVGLMFPLRILWLVLEAISGADGFRMPSR